MLAIDHVVLAVRDLNAAAERLLAEHGLASVAGGRHPRWGTANRIVPLGAAYLELLAVVDPGVARSNPLGRLLLGFTAEGDRWFTVCLSDDDLDGTARRLGLEIANGARERPDGAVIRWRSCAFEDDPERASRLPFFIEWDVAPELHPGRAPAEHPCGATGIARVDTACDPASLAAWLGGAELPIRSVDGQPGLRAVALTTAGGVDLVCS